MVRIDAKTCRAYLSGLSIRGNKSHLASAVPNFDCEAIDILLSLDQGRVVILTLDDDWWALNVPALVHSINSVFDNSHAVASYAQLRMRRVCSFLGVIVILPIARFHFTTNVKSGAPSLIMDVISTEGVTNAPHPGDGCRRLVMEREKSTNRNDRASRA